MSQVCISAQSHTHRFIHTWVHKDIVLHMRGTDVLQSEPGIPTQSRLCTRNG